MSENLKRMLTLLLAAAMIFSMMPIGASAQDTVAEEALPEVIQQEETPEATKPAEKPETLPVIEGEVQLSGSAVPLELGVQQEVVITEVGSRVKLSFTPEEDGVYIFQSFLPEGVDANCYLYNAEGDYLLYDDDGGEFWNFCLGYALTAGQTYYYDVGFNNSGETGTIPVLLDKSFVKSISVAPLTVYEYMNGGTEYHYTDDGTQLEYFRYYIGNLMWDAVYTATLSDGTQVQGSGSEFEYNGSSYSFKLTDTQSYENRWTVGNTYTFTAALLGAETEVSVTIVPNPLVSLSLTPVSVMENTHGGLQNYWDEETQQDVPLYTYRPGEILWMSEYRAEFSDGTVLTGRGGGFEYQGEYYNFTWDYVDQGLHNPWTAGNTYTVEMKAMGKPVVLEISVVKTPLQSLVFDPLSVQESTHGYFNTAYNDETQQWDLEYFYYNSWDLLENATYTATFNDGTVITGTGYNQEYGDYGIPYNGEFYSFENNTNQSYETAWVAGNTYSVTVKILGIETELPVNITPSPLVSLTFTPVSVPAGSNGGTSWQWNEDTGEHDLHWFNYYTGSLLSKSTYTATFLDGTVLSGDTHVDGHGYGFMYNGEFYSFETSTQQSYENPWVAGNTYEMSVKVMGKKTTLPVTITECPVISVTAEPITIVEGQNGYEQTYYPSEGEPTTYFEYRWYQKLNLTVTLADGSTIQTGGGIYYNGESYNASFLDDQDYENPWVLGDTYTGIVSVAGFYLDVPVTITESPIASVSFAPITLEENKGGHWSWSSEVGEFYRYNWHEKLAFTITFRDGTVLSGDRWESVEHDGVWYCIQSTSDDQSSQPWYAGNEYLAQANINGKWYDVPVSVMATEESGGFRYLVQGDTAIITGCTLQEEVLTIPAELNGYAVVGITSLGESMGYATEIIIPDSVKMLSSDLLMSSDNFWGKMPLKKLVLGAGISDITMDMVLWGCEALNLEAVEVSANNPYLCSVDGVVYDKDCTMMLLYPPAKKSLHIVPDTATDINAVFQLPGVHGITDFQLQFGAGVEGYKMVDGIIYDEDMREVLMATAEATGKYVMPETVRWINDGAFAGSNLTSVTVSPNVTYITYCSFANSLSLEEIVIPESVRTIEDGAFDGCTGLKKVGISDLEAWCQANIYSNPLYYAHDLYLNGELIVDLVIPESVTESVYGYSIYDNVFNGGSFKTVTMPEDLQTIGYDAFVNCENLEKVYITDLQDWSNNQFDNATANPLYYAKNLYLNGTLVTDLVLSDMGIVSAYSFYNANIKSLTVAEAVYEIGYQSFYGSAVETINFQGPLEYIGCDAFRKSGLKSLTLPDNLWGLGESAFADCTSLETLDLGSGVEEITWSCFRNTGIQSLTLPKQVKTVCPSAFANSRIKDLKIECDMVYIAEYAFENCPLGDLHFGDNVEYIGEEAFVGSKATQITLPSSVTELSYRTFAFNSNLVSVTVPESITYIPGTSFEGDKNLDHVLYTGSEEQWHAAEFYSPEILDATVHFGTVGNEVTTTQDCSTVTMFCSICNETKVFYKGSADHNLVNGVCTICGHEGDWEYIVEDGKATIVAYYGAATKVQMPSMIKGKQVVGFASNVFAYNENITAVTLPSLIRGIPNEAFYGCVYLREVKMSDAMESIGDRAFYGCRNLKTINLSDTIQHIGEAAFSECGIEELKIPAGVTEIAYAAFAGCWQIQQLDIPETVTTICYDAFASCWQLSELDIPGNIQEIQGNAFAGCELRSVRFYGDMPNLHYNAFSNSGISIYFPASNSTWNNLIPDGNNWYPCYTPEIFMQPYAPAGQVGETVTALVYADGCELSYQWYCAAPGSAKFTLAAGEDGNSLSVNLNKANSGTKAYCLVTDILGQTAKSETVTFKVETPATGIYLAKLPYTLEYDLHQALRTRGLEVVLTFEDNTEEVLEEYLYTVTGYDPNTAGEQTITVTYGTFTATFKVTVNGENTTLTDPMENVEISAPNGVVDSNTQLVVERVEEESTDLPVIPEVIQMNNAVIFDITLEKNGEEIQPTEAVQVSIPVPRYMEGKRCKVFFIDDNGNATDMGAQYNDGRMVFQTTHFSYYALVEVTGATVSGFVTGSNTSGAVVKLISGNEVLETVSVSADGAYRFENVAEGSYILEAFKEGLTPKQIQILVENQDILQDILMAILGDVNGDTTINTDDVVAMLLYISMPDLFPVDADCDFDGDDLVTTDDAVKLLLHISMPDLFPL